MPCGRTAPEAVFLARSTRGRVAEQKSVPGPAGGEGSGKRGLHSTQGIACAIVAVYFGGLDKWRTTWTPRPFSSSLLYWFCYSVAAGTAGGAGSKGSPHLSRSRLAARKRKPGARPGLRIPFRRPVLPGLRTIPVVNFLFRLVLGQAVPLLDLAFELIARPLIAVRSSSVSLPHFSLTWPLTCFQIPSTRFQSMGASIKDFEEVRTALAGSDRPL
jgi:hypothetical protein